MALLGQPIDERTAALALPLPHIANHQEDDVTRNRAALEQIDTALQLMSLDMDSRDDALAAAAQALASDPSIAHQYRHHLFLRFLYQRGAEEELISAYLAHLAGDAEMATQHPWELICLYRALLSWEMGASGEAVIEHLHQAIGIIESASVGPTLRLIGCMIHLVAYVVTGDKDKLEFAKSSLAELTSSPLAGSKPLQMLLDCTREVESLPLDPDPEDMQAMVDKLLFCLPFNYR